MDGGAQWDVATRNITVIAAGLLTRVWRGEEESGVSPLTNEAYGVNHLYDVRRRRLMADPIEDIIGDYRAFAAQQRDRLATRGIDITPYGLSHLAYRVPEWDQYVHVRGLIERHGSPIARMSGTAARSP